MGIMSLVKKLAGSEREDVSSRSVGRNEPCWCGSGKKYKKCHHEEDSRKAAIKRSACCTTSA